MNYKQDLLTMFYSETDSYTWLFKKDRVCAAEYSKVLNYITALDLETLSEEILMEVTDDTINLIANLSLLLADRATNSSCWEAPKVVADNELVHENGHLTENSIELLSTAIGSKDSVKCLVSDTGKIISFGEKWYSMIGDCGFKTVAVTRLTDFISKFIAPNGWKSYFVGNIGKNQKRLIQEYHVMDKYNLKHGTSYAALHLGGDTTKCVLLEVETESSDGRGEPKSIKFLEIGAHTIIDRYDTSSYKTRAKKVITEATIEDLAALLDIN